MAGYPKTYQISFIYAIGFFTEPACGRTPYRAYRAKFHERRWICIGEIFGEFGFEAIDIDAAAFERFDIGDVFARVIGLLAAERFDFGLQSGIFKAIACCENGGYEEAFAGRKKIDLVVSTATEPPATFADDPPQIPVVEENIVGVVCERVAARIERLCPPGFIDAPGARDLENRPRIHERRTTRFDPDVDCLRHEDAVSECARLALG